MCNSAHLSTLFTAWLICFTGSALISSLCYSAALILTWVCMRLHDPRFSECGHQTTHIRILPREFAISIAAWAPPHTSWLKYPGVTLRDLLLQVTNEWLCVLNIDTHWFKPVGLRWGQLGQALAMPGDILIHICCYWHPTVHRTAPCSKE